MLTVIPPEPSIPWDSPKRGKRDRTDTASTVLSDQDEFDNSWTAIDLDPRPANAFDPFDQAADEYQKRKDKISVYQLYDDYFDFQVELNRGMRTMLLDWLLDIHHHFELESSTLYLTVNLFDRFLARRFTKKEDFQLVGLTAFFIAAKMEEVDPIAVHDLVYLCQESYSAQTIVKFEKEMLFTLNFRLSPPSADFFLYTLAAALECDTTVQMLACFFSEHALLCFDLCLQYDASVRGAASIVLAKCCSQDEPPSEQWFADVERVSGFSISDLSACCSELCALLEQEESTSCSVHAKYEPHVSVPSTHKPEDLEAIL